MSLLLNCNTLAKRAVLLANHTNSSLPRWWIRAVPVIIQRTSFSRPTEENISATSSAVTCGHNPEFFVASPQIIEPPTMHQLRRVAIQAAVPMVGFGFTDQALMIHAGHCIDCTIGVTFGLSTLAAAAVGQIIANSGGIVFGESLQRVFTKFSWLEPSHLNATQLSLPVVERARFAGTFLGLIAGCILGLVNLAFIDTERTSNLKMNKAVAKQEEDRTIKSLYEINISNQHEKHHPATTIILRGPHMEGIISTMLLALQEESCSVLELSAKPFTAINSTNKNEVPYYEYVFVIRRNGSAIPDRELESLSRKLVEQKLNAMLSSQQRPKEEGISYNRKEVTGSLVEL